MRIILFSMFCLAVSTAMPYDIIEDETGHEYYAVPMNREKRYTLFQSFFKTNFYSFVRDITNEKISFKY